MTAFTADGPAPESLPHHIGRYRIVERIGKGAMGVVYAADDETMGRRVAIKVMMADLEEEPEVRERFYREAKVTGQLAHRNIVTVFDLGEDRGHPYIVMELLTGLPLAEYLRTPSAASLDAKIDLMIQMCEGLQVAHGRGVIHRDIKPSNLFVQRDGTLKILDFGVARLATSSLTLSGFLVGTPEYMSPEQAQAKPVDARSDLFSAAGVCYFMLAGRGPFASPELPKVLHAVMHEHPAPLTDAEAPEQLRRALAKALAKAPAERYQQSAEMLAELERVRRTYDATTRRIVQAALDRYRQILGIIEERRALGRSLAIADIDASCDAAAARLAARFLMFANAESDTLLEPVDRSVASAALETLQTRHNAEAAALAALRADAVDSLRRRDHVDQGDDGPQLLGTVSPSIPARAAALWRRLLTTRGRP